MNYLYHYTSLNGLLGILKKDGLHFHGTRYDCLNDPNEYIFPKNVVLPLLIKSLKGTEYDIRDYDEAYPYFVSFSKAKDCLDMWRLYGAEIALVINPKFLKELPMDNRPAICREVVYVESEEEIHNAAVELFNTAEVQDHNPINHFIDSVFPFIKHKNYETEQEVRLAWADYKLGQFFSDTGDLVECEIPTNVHCDRSRNGLLQFYKNFKVKKAALVKIVVNASNPTQFERLEHQIGLLLRQRNYDEKRIQITKSKCASFTETAGK